MTALCSVGGRPGCCTSVLYRARSDGAGTAGFPGARFWPAYGLEVSSRSRAGELLVGICRWVPTERGMLVDVRTLEVVGVVSRVGVPTVACCLALLVTGCTGAGSGGG